LIKYVDFSKKEVILSLKLEGGQHEYLCR